MRTACVCSQILMLCLLCVWPAYLQASPGSCETEGLELGRELPRAYAVVIKQSTYDDPDWRLVADALLARYDSELFIWTSSLYDVLADLTAYQPTHIGFVCDVPTASPSFVQSSVWPIVRILDPDTYGDAIWGIITGFDAQDALNLVTGPTGFEVKTVLGGTGSCDLDYYTQGIRTYEATYCQYSIKYPDSPDPVTFYDGPTDRTEWLVTMINEGIDVLGYDPVDIFYTSGHGNYNQWQLHYPTSGLEGYFRSSNGQAYGDPYSGANININSTNPKIFFGLGNCYIGKIIHGGCMAPCWIHTAGAYQYTGYVIAEGATCHQHGGTKAYFYRVARNYTWAEAYFLANQALRFDQVNSTPGASPPDLNGSALYGDPGMQVVMSQEGIFREPLFSTALTVTHGGAQDTVTFRMTMNREGSPGYTSKWGERHPAVILPFRAEGVTILNTNAMAVVVTENFALMYVWHQGQAPLAEGETREVVFICEPNVSGIDDEPDTGLGIGHAVLQQNRPNPIGSAAQIAYTLPQRCRVSLQVYDVTGKLVESLVDEVQDGGDHSAVWETGDIGSGLYFYRLSAGAGSETRRCVVLK
ncbi:MAG: T9SS type A sorting domain-containing protein [Candidatus Eisenbacteria sp.]|nr:T9SS type A sorting domain-containing protein [Candidatus Eisenbacteria bacterium]